MSTCVILQVELAFDGLQFELELEAAPLLPEPEEA